MEIERLLFGVIAILIVVIFVALFLYWELNNERRTSEMWLRTVEVIAQQRDECNEENRELKYRLRCYESSMIKLKDLDR